LTPVLEKALRVSGVPEKLLPLFALSHDLRWTWRPEVRALFEFLDPETWKRVGGNPVRLFREAPAERLWRAAEDPTYQAELLGMVRRLTEEDLAEPRHPAARELVANGERVATEVLAGPDLAKIVTFDGVTTPVVTDGPFQEFKEWVAGYQIVDVESEARAIEIAAKLSAVPGPGGRSIEQPIIVRQIMDGGPSNAVEMDGYLETARGVVR
jgi:hypothetical protein